jgi:hypothetical protein
MKPCLSLGAHPRSRVRYTNRVGTGPEPADSVGAPRGPTLGDPDGPGRRRLKPRLPGPSAAWNTVGRGRSTWTLFIVIGSRARPKRSTPSGMTRSGRKPRPASTSSKSPAAWGIDNRLKIDRAEIHTALSDRPGDGVCLIAAGGRTARIIYKPTNQVGHERHAEKRKVGGARSKSMIGFRMADHKASRNTRIMAISSNPPSLRHLATAFQTRLTPPGSGWGGNRI